MKLKTINCLDRIEMQRLGQAWCAEVTFKGARLYPEDWAVPEDERVSFQFISAHGNGVALNDEEAYHDCCAQVARFLLACYALDQQGDMTRRVMRKHPRKG